MNYCEFRNLTIKHMAVTSGGGLLPPEYQQVEYLQSSGSQYIDTGIKINSNIEVHCTGQFLQLSFFCALVGGRNPSDNNISGRFIPFGIRNTEDFLRLCYASDDTSSAVQASNINSVIYNNAQHQILVNGALLKTANAQLTNSNAVNMTLFGLNGYPSGVEYKGTGRLFDVSIYNNTTSEQLRDYIPCYRKSDNKPGMYDLVTSTFFTNAGSGEFTVGNPV